MPSAQTLLADLIRLLDSTTHAPRKVPIHLQDAFHHEIRNLEKLGILEETKDVTEWVNSFVIVEKKTPDVSNSQSDRKL